MEDDHRIWTGWGTTLSIIIPVLPRLSCSPDHLYKTRRESVLGREGDFSNHPQERAFDYSGFATLSHFTLKWRIAKCYGEQETTKGPNCGGEAGQKFKDKSRGTVPNEKCFITYHLSLHLS